MKLNLLLTREPFQKIFNKTVSKFLKLEFGWDGEIEWGSRFNYKKTFLVNKYLNLIFPSNILFSKFNKLVKEHLFDKSPLRNFLRLIYVQLSNLFITKYLLSSNSISFTKYMDYFDNFVFLGGNNTIKIIDLKKKECIVLKKVGFSPEFFKSTIRNRIKYSYLFANEIIDYNLNQYWFKEKLFEGIPLDRQKNSLAINKSFLSAKQKMITLYEKTYFEISSIEYLETISEKISFEIKYLNKSYKESIKDQLFSSVSLLKRSLSSLFNNNIFLPISLTHGDFNRGNIIFNEFNNQTDIVDWEYSDERIVWYDSFSLLLNSSNPVGLSKRIGFFSKNYINYLLELFWLNEFEKFELDIKVFFNLFILENLLIRLKQSNISKTLYEDNGMILFIEELKKLKY